MLELTSDTMRSTDIVYKYPEEVSDLKKYEDYSVYKTGNKKEASMPAETFINPANGSDAIVSNPQNPLEVIIIQKPDDKLGIPGGYNSYAEDPLDGVVKKFKKKVHFNVNGEEFIAEPIAGYIGRPNLLKMKKVTRPAGPFMGLFGLPLRDPRRQAIANLYHLIISEQYVNPIPTGGNLSKDAFYCNVLELLARNMDKLTDDLNSHPLKDKVEEVLKNDKDKLSESGSEDSNIASLDKCAQEFGNDYIFMIYRYYLFLVEKKIVNADGSNGKNYEKYNWMYNKSELLRRVKNKNLVL
jgi:hypothetical protein